MDMQKGLPLSSETKEETLREMTTCCLCGTHLEFKHTTSVHEHKVQEVAKCPACGIQTKVNTFILQ